MDAQNWFPRIKEALCNGCGNCISICPIDVFIEVHGRPIIRNPLLCNYCGLCEEICPVAAIELPYLVCIPDENEMVHTMAEQSNSAGYTFLEDLNSLIQGIPADSIVSRTIYKDPYLKAVLFGFDKGQALSEHSAAQIATIQILSGQASITLGNDTYEVESGAWLHMPPRLTHSITAKSPLVMLLLLLSAEAGQ